MRPIMLTIILAILLATVHLFIGKLKFLGSMPRNKWLSFGAGLSVSYVFVHLLPELYEYHDLLTEHSPHLSIPDEIVFVSTLAGFVLFYGLERSAAKIRVKEDGETKSGKGVFYIHLASFFLYNFFIGYLISERAEEEMLNAILFTIAIAFHFVVIDFSFTDSFRDTYNRTGRWMLSAAILCGAVVGITTHLEHLIVGIAVSVLAGAIILNTIKEELPGERKANFFAFLAGATIYAGLLLIL